MARPPTADHDKARRPILYWKTKSSGRGCVRWCLAKESTSANFPAAGYFKCNENCRKIWLEISVQFELKKNSQKHWYMRCSDPEDVQFDGMPELFHISGFGGKSSIALYQDEWWVVLDNYTKNWKSFNFTEDHVNRLVVLHNILPYYSHVEDPPFDRAVFDNFMEHELRDGILTGLPNWRPLK